MSDPQCELDLSTPGPPQPPEPARHDPITESDALIRRLRDRGLPPHLPVRTHANRQVLLRFHPARGLRLHRGFAYAPDDVLHAIITWIAPGPRPRGARARARRLFAGFPVHLHVPPDRPRTRRAERRRAGDHLVLERLADLHRRLNAARFGGLLREVPFRLSAKMQRRLGEVRADPVGGDILEIAISRRHLARDGWAAVEHTVLHEMVHQWQVETGRPLDHGPAFRRKAREVGIAPRATAVVIPAPRPRTRGPDG